MTASLQRFRAAVTLLSFASTLPATVGAPPPVRADNRADENETAR